MNSTYRLAVMGLLVAIGTLASQLISIPVLGVAKAFPVQHAINVVAAILLGPVPAVMIAFVIGLLRNLMGVGSLLAFPGGMIGAFLAGYLYQKVKRKWGAAVGEIFGTGILGSLASVPIANLLMGKSVGALAFVPSFLASTIAGTIIGLTLATALQKLPVFQQQENLNQN